MGKRAVEISARGILYGCGLFEESDIDSVVIGGKRYTLTPVDPDQDLRDRVIAQIDSNPYDNRLYDMFRSSLNMLRAEVEGSDYKFWTVTNGVDRIKLTLYVDKP